MRWQAQDEEGALLRDQLKQAAHLWDEKGRTADLLWTGTAYREFELWRERYPGVLTAIEEAFGRAMADRARRRKRVRTAVIASMIVALAGVAIAVSVSRQRLAVAALRAEAAKLLALAELRLQEDPTEALALATAALEQADTREGRVFAMRALWEAPPALELSGDFGLGLRVPAFSPDGTRLAAAGHSAEVRVWSDDGRGPVLLPGHEMSTRGPNRVEWAANDLLVTGEAPDGGHGWFPLMFGPRARLWSLPEGRPVRTIPFGGPTYWLAGRRRLLAGTVVSGTPEQPGTLFLRSWSLPDGEPVVLGRIDARELRPRITSFAPGGRGWLYAKDGNVYSRPLPPDAGADRLFARPGAGLPGLMVSWDQLSVADGMGGIRVWSSPEKGGPEIRTMARPDTAPAEAWPDPSGRWLAVTVSGQQQVRLWDLAAWPVARHRALRRSGTWYSAVSRVHPAGDWVVASTANYTRLTFWPLRRTFPFVVDGYSIFIRPLAFTPDGKWLATSWRDRQLRLWPLPGSGIARARQLELPETALWTSLAFDPRGRSLFAVGNQDHTWVAPLDGSSPRKLEGFSRDSMLYGAALSPSGLLAATAFGEGPGPRTLRVWNLETGEVRLLGLPMAEARAW